MPVTAVQLCRYQHCQYRGGAANISRDGYESFGHGRMKLRQFLKTCADAMKLVNFVQNRFKSHGCAPFMGLKGRELQMDCLASEDLKEEKA